jgi:hypothetical protein
MTPQSAFMVVAPVVAGREGDLRKLLASMNRRPGVVDPDNALVPFGRFDRLHFARFVLLEDRTAADVTAHGVPRPNVQTSLAFLGEADGSADELVRDLARHADAGLRRIFSHCERFVPDGDLLRWMREGEHPPAALYVNRIGRTVRQIREEELLNRTLSGYLADHAAQVEAMTPRELHAELRRFVEAERQAGRLRLSPPEPTPLGWALRNAAHLTAAPLLLLAVVGLLLTPVVRAPFLAVLVLGAAAFLYLLRRRERRDPEIVPRPEPDRVAELADLEDHDVTNQFTALGTVKPGLFRGAVLRVALWGLDWGVRHVYGRGHLTRVRTIHFARWVYLDGRRRMLFASNYDGSLESYMDDFINKVAWGLNLVFSNGVGYPRTRWLLLGGAKTEQKFKRFIRRHQLPTEVWYNAHPGLTVVSLERNTRIREGLERATMSDAALREWIALL